MGDYSRFHDAECVYVHASSCLDTLFCQAGPWRGRGGAHFTVVLALSGICLANGTTEDNYDYYVLLYAKHYVSFSMYSLPVRPPPIPRPLRLILSQPCKTGVSIIPSTLQMEK